VRKKDKFELCVGKAVQCSACVVNDVIKFFTQCSIAKCDFATILSLLCKDRYWCVCVVWNADMGI